MRARVRDDFPYGYPVTSCGGISFLKNTWTPVPLGMEREVLDNPYLEAASEEELELDLPVIEEPKTENMSPLASKAALALADENQVAITRVTGSGKDGLITVGDVRAFLDAKVEKKPGEEQL